MNINQATRAAETHAELHLPDDAIRADLIDRTLQSLIEDSERCEGELARADINRAYFRRKLTISECAEVEKQLRQRTISILESEEDVEDDNEPVRINSIPLPSRPFLTEAEEVDCGRKIQFYNRLRTNAGFIDPIFKERVMREAEEAKARFVETNLRYVWKLAGKKVGGQHLTREDLFQEGMIGLLRAADLYDPELGFRFKTYATWWIQQSIHRAKDNSDRTVRIPVHLKTKLHRIKRTQAKLANEIGRAPTPEELAAVLGIKADLLAKLLWRIHVTNCVEADAPIGEDFTAIDAKKDDDAESAFDIVSNRELRATLQKVLMQLSAREERVIRMRFGFDGDNDHTLESVGQQFGLTRERIRQIEAKAMRKLANPFRMRLLKSFVES